MAKRGIQNTARRSETPYERHGGVVFAARVVSRGAEVDPVATEVGAGSASGVNDKNGADEAVRSCGRHHIQRSPVRQFARRALGAVLDAAIEGSPAPLLEIRDAVGKVVSLERVGRRVGIKNEAPLFLDFSFVRVRGSVLTEDGKEVVGVLDAADPAEMTGELLVALLAYVSLDPENDEDEDGFLDQFDIRPYKNLSHQMRIDWNLTSNNNLQFDYHMEDEFVFGRTLSGNETDFVIMEYDWPDDQTIVTYAILFDLNETYNGPFYPGGSFLWHYVDEPDDIDLHLSVSFTENE